MKRVIYVITGNKDKFFEISSILADVVQCSIDLVEIQSLDNHKIIKEKLKQARSFLPDDAILVEDTSLCFEALGGLPGPLIKMFRQALENDGLVKMLENFENYKAEAKTLVGYYDGEGGYEYFEGSVRGTIVPPRGDGFGWGPIFLPDGHTKTFGEMNINEKNAISMRKIALEKLKEYLQKQK